MQNQSKREITYDTQLKTALTNLFTYRLAFTACTTLRNVCLRARLFLRMPGVVRANVVAIHSRTSSLTSSEYRLLSSSSSRSLNAPVDPLEIKTVL